MILQNQNSIEMDSFTVPISLPLQEVERITRPAYERSLAEMQEYWRNRFKREEETNQMRNEK